MIQINDLLITQVNDFLAGGDRSFLQTLLGLDRDDITGQATVRYLMQLNHWPFTPGSDFAETLEHLFAEYPERKKVVPEEYQTITFDLIKNAWSYECVKIEVVPDPEPKEKPVKKSKKSKATADEEENLVSGSKKFKSLSGDIDTSSASDRLKRVIDIQRGN